MNYVLWGRWRMNAYTRRQHMAGQLVRRVTGISYAHCYARPCSWPAGSPCGSCHSARTRSPASFTKETGMRPALQPAPPAAPVARAAVAAGVIALLLSSLWAGLLRLGWDLPTPRATLAALHGPLIVCG